MLVIPDLRRFDPVDDSYVMFKGIPIARGWQIPENIWAVVQRVERIQDAAISLCDHALDLLKSASDYVKLVNRHDDFLFRRGEIVEDSSPNARPPRSINKALCLTLRTKAVIDWNNQYFAARRQLDKSISAFASLVTSAEFLQNAYQWCPPGSRNRSDLDEWYQGKVQSLLLEAPKWTKFNFTFRDILLEIAYRRAGTKIIADVLTNADPTATHGVLLKWQQIYKLGFGLVDGPSRRLAWVSDKLPEEIAKQDRGAGTLV